MDGRVLAVVLLRHSCPLVPPGLAYVIGWVSPGAVHHYLLTTTTITALIILYSLGIKIALTKKKVRSLA